METSTGGLDEALDGQGHRQDHTEGDNQKSGSGLKLCWDKDSVS